MPSRTSKARRPAAKTGTRGKKSAKFLILIGVMGLFLLVDLVVVVVNKSTETKLLPVQTVLEFNGSNQPCGPFQAWDITALSDGRIAVSDQNSSRILFFDRQGQFLLQVGNQEAGPPPFKEISCLTKDPSGNVYVIDAWNGLIRGFDPKGKALPVVDISSRGFYGPRGVAWDNGSFLIADTGSHRLARVSPDGAVQGSWGHHGSGKEDFNNPYQVATDGQGHYDVVDRDNDRIQVVGADGKFLKAIKLDAPPQAEAVDPDRKVLYVSSLDGRFIRAYSPDGKVLGVLAQADPKNPQPLQGVNAISVLPGGDIVTYRDGKITIYRLNQPL